jgi:hypothetical protein
MKRLLMVAFTLGLTAMASAAVAGASGAQTEPEPAEPIPGTMEVRPSIVAPGGALTAESISPCHPDGAVEWEVVQLAGGGDVGPLGGSAQADADGHWVVDFAAPDDVGRYQFSATCTAGDSAPYTYFAGFSAQYETSPEPPDPAPEPQPEPEPDSPAAPATPVEAEPTFTG